MTRALSWAGQRTQLGLLVWTSCYDRQPTIINGKKNVFCKLVLVYWYGTLGHVPASQNFCFLFFIFYLDKKQIHTKQEPRRKNRQPRGVFPAVEAREKVNGDRTLKVNGQGSCP